MLTPQPSSCPPHAKQDWQLRRREDLSYVAATQAMKELIKVEPLGSGAAAKAA
jgi:hypothetical protein